jgi:ERCC4-type nuclease
MIMVDPRAGSVDYIPILKSLGAPVEAVGLEFGDAAFYAKGFPRGIGVELKKLNDMLQCITTGRFSGHQLPGLARDYDVAYLIVEGFWRPGDDGVLETWRHGGWTPVQLGKRVWMYRDFDAFLNTMEIRGGITVKRTVSPEETGRVLYGLYDWWQSFDGHRAHLALNRSHRDGALFIRPTLARRVAAELPGVGFDRSGDVAKAFPTVLEMVCATEKEWRGVKGIGKTLAKKIVEAWSDAA